VLVARIDIGFGRICTFEFSTTPTLLAFPFTTEPVLLPARTDVDAAGTLTMFTEAGSTTTPGKNFVSISGTSMEETDVGDESSVFMEMSSVSRDCNESHSSAVISVMSGLVLSPYRHIPSELGESVIST